MNLSAKRNVLLERSCRNTTKTDWSCSMTRREAREAVFGLLFETEFRSDEPFDIIYKISTENREIHEDSYIREVYFGTLDKLSQIDEIIEAHAKGWSISRMSHVSRTVLRLAVYEMLYMRDRVPLRVSINELSKKFDHERARGFINGILNAVKNDLPANDTASPVFTAETAESEANPAEMTKKAE